MQPPALSFPVSNGKHEHVDVFPDKRDSGTVFELLGSAQLGTAVCKERVFHEETVTNPAIGSFHSDLLGCNLCGLSSIPVH